ncbi:MAG: hypothetical protein ACOVME_09930, partial [Rhodobacter sp.]
MIKNNGLQKCLKNRQSSERVRIQGKFRPFGMFCAELSTEIVDRFLLAHPHLSLQARPGIGEFQKGWVH